MSSTEAPVPGIEDRGSRAAPPFVVPPDSTLDSSACGNWSSCSLWWQRTPPLVNERVGLIGAFRAEDPAGAERILERACAGLARRGCTLAIGPMDGSTWNTYRCITASGTEPVFFMEPSQPPGCSFQFRRAGFSEIARYNSRLQSALPADDPRLDSVAERLHAQGVAIRALDRSRAEAELKSIHEVVATAFRGSFLYTPIPFSTFHELYGLLLASLDGVLILLAEHNDQCVGFVLGFPDLLEQRRKGGTSTFIVKTVAVLPERTYAGLGRFLWATLCRRAAELGYARVINALMRDDGRSFNMSRPHSAPMRGYALFARRLT